MIPATGLNTNTQVWVGLGEVRWFIYYQLFEHLERRSFCVTVRDTEARVFLRKFPPAGWSFIGWNHSQIPLTKLSDWKSGRGEKKEQQVWCFYTALLFWRVGKDFRTHFFRWTHSENEEFLFSCLFLSKRKPVLSAVSVREIMGQIERLKCAEFNFFLTFKNLCGKF